MPLIRKRQLETWAQLSGEERDDFLDSLPAGVEDIELLFDFLDTKLENEACPHNMNLTLQLVMAKRLDFAKVMAWLNENGAYCDCEVLKNIEPVWFAAVEGE
jgi:hypothetical protein